jgi:predicted aldo/keto reductase-like oxidoreductase
MMMEHDATGVVRRGPMQFRRFGTLDFDVSVLGFGAMRLPTREGRVDEAETIRMIRYAIDHGVNYVDTAYPYHGGQSEVVVGRALADGYRQKVKVATKLPCWEVHDRADFDRLLDIQLGRLGLPCVDFYLLHALSKDTWPRMRSLGVLDWAKGAIAAGRFRHLGFSFHDSQDVFREIVDAYDWSMCQVQYNYMDVESQAGREGVRYAASKGIPVVVMEPLLGGKLVNPPGPIRSLWDGARRKRSAAAWALDWLWDQPEVTTVLSGMTTMEQVRENVALAAASRTAALTAEEKSLVDQVRARYREVITIPCTACNYCVPCPNGVDIPGNFSNYNDGIAFDKPEASRGQYAWWRVAFESVKLLDHDVRAACCAECGECEDKCPQSIPIARWMGVIHSVLGEGKPFVRSV